MKKILMYVMMALIVIGGVTAVSDMTIEWDNDIKVNCGSDKWWDFNTQICKDYELQEEFDEVTDRIADNKQDIKDNSKDIKRTTKKVNKVKTIVDENAAEWAKDNKGTSFSRVTDYLYSTFMDLITANFATKDELAISEGKCMLGTDATADNVYCYAALLRASQTGESHEVNGWIGNPEGTSCVQINVLA